MGDGPNNRYALVCSECHSHNGMALRDEFEYLTFRCAYCYTVNHARKKRPTLRHDKHKETERGVASRREGGGASSEVAKEERKHSNEVLLLYSGTSE